MSTASVLISRTTIRDVYVISNLRTNEQLGDYIMIGCASASSIARNTMENISNQLRVMEMWYVLILSGRAFELYKLIIRICGKEVNAVSLYYPWAHSIHYKIRDFRRYRIYVDGQLVDHSKLLADDQLMYDVCWAAAYGIISIDVKIDRCDDYFDSYYLFYYMIFAKQPFLATWFYVTWLISPNHYYALALAQYCCTDKRSIIRSKLAIEKHLGAKIKRHWELVQKSMAIDHHDQLLRMSYTVIDHTFRFGATLNFIRDRYHAGLIKMFSLIFGQRLKNIHGNDHISFVQEYNYGCANLIAHILHFVVCEVEIMTTFAELMNRSSAVYAELQDRQNIDFNEPIVIQFGCVGPFIHGPCCIVGRTFQYCWIMNNGLLDGNAEYKNATMQMRYRGEFKDNEIQYSFTEALVGDNERKTKKRISAAYREGTLHGICRVDDRVAAYNYGDLII